MEKLFLYTDNYFNLNRVLVFLFPILFSLLAIPTDGENIYVSRTSLKIYLNTESPAYAALEDTRNEWTTNYLNNPSKNFQHSQLRWGENKNLWVLELSSVMKYTKYSKDLNPLIVKVEKEELKKPEMMIPPEVLAEQLEVSEPTFDMEKFNPQRIRVAKNLIQASALASSPADPNSLDARLQEIIEKEKSLVYNPQKPMVIKNGISVASQGASTTKLPETKRDTSRRAKDSTVYNRSYKLSGDLTMKGGVAFTGFSDQIRVYRVSENLILDEGYVSIKDGYYEIEVRELYGYLIAELVGKNDELKGYAEIDLHQLNLKNIKPSDIEIKKNIKIRPYKEGFNVKAISGLSFQENDIAIPITEKNGEQVIDSGHVKISIHGLEEQLELDEENKITSDMFTSDSNMIVRLEAKNHWGSLAIGFGETNKKIRMYNNSMVKTLIGQYEESHDGYGIIWGRVIDENGKPVEGAKVELAGDLAENPIYFNKAYLPDYTVQATKADGLFAFIKVLPGLHAVRAKVNGKMLPVELTVADSDHVSFVQIRQDGTQNISLASYNPITRQQVDTSVKLHGLDKIYDIDSGQRNIEEWPGKRGLAILESDPGSSYELTRHMINRKDKHIEVPVVGKAWLQRTLEQFRANRDRTKGLVVGFVRGDGFEIYTGKELVGWQKTDIIYFDEFGRILPKKIGRSGGGFIMFNVPLGITSLSIIPKQSEKISTQLTITDREYTNVITANFNTR